MPKNKAKAKAKNLGHFAVKVRIQKVEAYLEAHAVILFREKLQKTKSPVPELQMSSL
jgi:ERCC4-related helicase